MRNRDAGWKIASAGTWTTDGLPAASEAINGARRMGLDISRHASQAITPQLMRDADLVIVMEQGQKEALRSEFPQCAGKVHVLSEAATGTVFDIPDPASALSGAEVPGEIDELIHEGFDRIRALAGTG